MKLDKFDLFCVLAGAMFIGFGLYAYPHQGAWFGSERVTVQFGLPGNYYRFTTTNPFYETVEFVTNRDLSVSSHRVTNRWVR